MRNIRSIIVFGATALVAGCSGGGSPTPSAPRATSPSNPQQTTSGELVGAKVTISIPARKQSSAKSRNASMKKHPAYVSPGSLGAVVSATSSTNSSDNERYGYGLDDAKCTGAGTATVCTLDIPLYADKYSITISVYDADESASASAPSGNLLSTDTEPETIAIGETNTLTNFLLHAQVDFFEGETATGTIDTFGAVGGTALAPAPSYDFVAEDADEFDVDTFGNATTYRNGPLAANAADLGDTTGCATFCFSATNDVGTSPGSPATISQASDTSFTLHYNGGGGPGAGVKGSLNGAAPTGQRPYAGSITAVAADGTDSAMVVPLFAYPTALNLTTNTGYVFAAQYATPTTAAANGSGYAAYFGTAGTTTCTGTSGTIATVGTGTYDAGYGEVFPVTGVNPGTCTLILSDGASPADTITVPVTVSTGGTAISVPCPNQPGNPTGDVNSRRSSTFRRDASVSSAGAVPQLVQYGTGVSSVALQKPITAGDILVVIAGDIPFYPSFTNTGTPPLSFDQFGDELDLSIDLVTVDTTASAGIIEANDGCNASFWVGEFSGTSERSIESANHAGTATDDQGNPILSNVTPSIVPNAENGLVIAASDSYDRTAATAQTGFTDYFQYSPFTSVDVQLANTATTDTMDPVTVTFGNEAVPDETFIFQIPPSTFVGTAPEPNLTKRTKAFKLSRYHMLKETYGFR